MVYLICFDRPYKHARHYLGSAEDVRKREDVHLAGSGARLLQVVNQAGISWSIVRLWYGGRDRERELKRWHSGVKLCPRCRRRK